MISPKYLVLYLNRVDSMNNKITTAVEPQMELTFLEKVYKLISIGNHIGNKSEFGHYTVHRIIGETWYLYNDSVVKKEKPKDWQSTYIAIYELI